MRIGAMAVMAAAFFVATVGGAAAQTQQDKARDVFEKNKDSVIWVTAVAKMEFSTAAGRSLGPARENKVQLSGTIVDPCGMTVVALSTIDPGALLNGKKVNLPTGEQVTMAVKTSHSEVKLVLLDGTEVPARIVLTDSTLDLAFICPEKADDKIKYKPVALDAADPKVLDPLVCLGRMSKSLGQAPAAAMAEVTAVVDSPRRFYVGGRNPGVPCFALDGKLVGISAMYVVQMGGQEANTVIIVPTKDLVKGAKEAMAKKDEPVAAEAPKDEKKDAK